MAGTTTRQRYLEAVVDCVISRGRTDLPLVTLAEAAGTSDRMLVYYFKTRDALLTEVVQSIRTRRRRRLAQALAALPNADSPEDGLRQVLDWVTSDDNAPHVRLYYDALVHSFNDEEPFAGFAQETLRDWVSEGTTAARALGADEERSRAFGTVLAATAMALAADRLITGEEERVDRCLAGTTAALLSMLRLGTGVDTASSTTSGDPTDRPAEPSPVAP
jgi:AcrR family transcriptional regulator